ncbi:MAG: M23 family metallopeptidase [Labilithrix sp.]|nr:M23 family metallopeptidase [Labilithrix sp.]
MARLSLLEIFGLDPIELRAREAWFAIRGDASVPATRFGLSSLGVLHPALSLKTWLGARRSDRRVPITNLFNRTQTPITAGWSVRKTQVRDFRGGTLTYDSHNGTDFAVPVGTVVVAAAPGKVLRISSEFNRGGLKVFIDHGRGLVTTSNHLARALVRVGDVVARGEPIALSGYSGIDALVAFPWSVPHVHFNVWLDGRYEDPFAASGETSLWIDGDDPRPPDGTSDAAWDGPDLDEASMDRLFLENYYPTRFPSREPLYREVHAREPRLTLPFRPDDFVGIMFPRT